MTPLDMYLDEVGTYDLLTPEEETELARRARAGDEGAEQALVLGNLRFVVHVAKRYRTYGVSRAKQLASRALRQLREGALAA